MSKKDFKPHKMYKDGKAVMANTYQQHLSLGKKEYDHSATPLKRKGCGPQSLGSAIKLAPILGLIAKKVIVDKVSEKISGGTPLKACWKTHERTPNTKEGTKGSCQHKDPSKRP